MAGRKLSTVVVYCLSQPNDLKREIKKKTGGAKQKSWGGHGPPRFPLRIATDAPFRLSWTEG